MFFKWATTKGRPGSADLPFRGLGKKKASSKLAKGCQTIVIIELSLFCEVSSWQMDVLLKCVLARTTEFTNLYNLKGGIFAYAREVDNSLPTY